MKKLKRIGILVGILALLLFVVTNTDKVQISLFLWQPEIPLILLMLVLLLVGFAFGAYFTRNVGKDKKSSPSSPDVVPADTKPSKP